MSVQAFAFVQFDLASDYGLTPGRYPVRPDGQPDGEPQDVLVFEVVDALIGRPRRRRRSRPRDVAPADAGPVGADRRATVVRADAFAGESEAAAWLARAKGSEQELETIVARGLTVLNRALHAHRSAAQDAYVPDVSAERALAVRVGYGLGRGAGLRASGPRRSTSPTPEPQMRRVESLRPQERVARVLGGHETVDVCEALLLRARADLDAGRTREAALELRSGVAALLVELAGTGGPEQAADLSRASSRGARRSPPPPPRRSAQAPDAAELEGTLAIAERVIRRRRILVLRVLKRTCAQASLACGRRSLLMCRRSTRIAAVSRRRIRPWRELSP